MWFEELPENCPPEKAARPQGDVYYRLIDAPRISCKDFWSHRKIWPNKKFNAPECRARSVSVFSEIESCDNLRKLKLHSNKKIASIMLVSSSGKIQKSGQDKYHYSWWRALDFDPLAMSELIS